MIKKFRDYVQSLNEEDAALGAPPADAGGGDAAGGAPPGGDAGGADAGGAPPDMGGGAPPDMGGGMGGLGAGGGAPPDAGGSPPAAGAGGDIKIKLEEQPRDVFEFMKELDKAGFFSMPRK